MKIKEWHLKNYKSYGNVKTTITLNQNKGELILVVGENGSGKSSLLSSLDLAIFGEEQNKRGTKLSKNNLPNRTNNKLDVGVIFSTDETLEISRSMDNSGAAIKTKLLVDTIPYDKAGKIDTKILEKIGFDYKTFKSFISMNVNNFKNFISLTPEEKRLLLDKLFSLDQINDLNKVLKQLQKSNDLSFNTVNNAIKIYKDNIQEIQNTINNIHEKNKINNDEKFSELKKLLKSNKSNFLKLETERDDIQETINIFTDGLNKLKIKKQDVTRDIRDINEKIDLYKLGKCPTCLTTLEGDLNLLPTYKTKLDTTNNILNKLVSKIDKATIELNNCVAEFNNINKKLEILKDTVSGIKGKIDELKIDSNDNLDEFKKTISNIEIKIADNEEQYIEFQKMKYIYDILLPIWGENGIKRNIIESIIDPLNAFIAEDLIHLKTRFTVTLDNNFDAHIFEYNNEIDPETLSSGEAKKINIIIMLAYIKMLRLKKDINILFLDEVFATIDVEGIDDILILFKKFANDRGINIFLIHHSELKEWFFDRIINVKKSTFSYLEEKIIN